MLWKKGEFEVLCKQSCSEEMNMKCNEIQIWSSNSDLDDKRIKSNWQKGKYFTVQTVHERKKKTKKSSQIGKISKGTAAATVTKQERKRKLSSF